MIGASTSSYVYPRICGSFFFFSLSLPSSPRAFLRPLDFSLPRFLPRLPIHRGGSVPWPSGASLILRPFPGRFTWMRPGIPVCTRKLSILFSFSSSCSRFNVNSTCYIDVKFTLTEEKKEPQMSRAFEIREVCVFDIFVV